MVSFPTAQVTASVGIPFDYPCTGTGTNVMVNIVLLNDGPNDGFSQVFTQSGSTLVFNSSMPGNFTFVCTGVNSIGSDTAVLTIKVRPLSENIEMITSIMPGEVITPEEAAQLVSVSLTTLLNYTSQLFATLLKRLFILYLLLLIANKISFIF